MKSAGIVRRIDDLGRVVIPKEIRRRLKIREGDPLEVYTEKDGEVVLRKYSPLGEMKYFVKQYVEALAAEVGHLVCITDRDEVVAASGSNSKDFVGRIITRELEDVIDKRRMFVRTSNEAKFVNIIEGQNGYYSEIIGPIISEGDVVGAVIILGKDADKILGDIEIKLVNCAVSFLGKQFET